MSKLLAAFALAFAVMSALTNPAVAQPIDTGHLVAELVSEKPAIAPGETIHVALRQKIQKGWHTYWRNAGDSGEATRLQWTLPPGWTAGAFTWPTPRRIPLGPLVNYGYEGEVLLPMTLTAPADAKPGQATALKAQASFLVCAEICVPEDAALTLSLPVVAAPAPADARWAGPIAATLAAAPKPAGLAAVFETHPTGIALAVTGAALKGADMAGAYFYPFESTVIDHAKAQPIERGPDGLTLTLTPGPAFQGGKSPAALAGVLSLGDKAFEISAAPGLPAAGASGLGPPPVEVKAPVGPDLGLAAAAAFALLGGLILNLMPCVFPVLAMKAASLAGHGGGAHREARRQGLAFGAGVLVAFLTLAGLLIALKAAGSAVGWGFQLQSPPVVAALALLILAIALNLSGVFEMGASLQGMGSGLTARNGLIGAFFTGALAVVVAAPCTAPFMGSALGWALTQPPAAALVVFAALGVGFAAPFVLVAFAPALLDRLPRPGPWMAVFRKALAFPMYGAAAWLVWVLTLQAGATALARILAAAIVVGLAAWLAGAAQRRAAAGKPSLALIIGAALAAAVAIFAAVGPGYADEPLGAPPTPATDKAQVVSEPYSPQRLAELRGQGRVVFVNYTAAWCVSCQVNDRVAISTMGVAQAMKAHNVAYLKADWTRKDAAIAAELAHYGRAGVPLYLVYGAGGGEAVILPSLLTEGMLVKALDAAAARAPKGG
jgi:thiol:disulfide interchange protein DsbD